MTLIEKYIAGWRAHDLDAILETLTDDCVVIESFGPVYHGHQWIKAWVATWLSQGGQVLEWTMRDIQSFGDIEIAEWTFHYKWRGEENTFDGATVAKLNGGKLSYLREYATTADLYHWQGRFL